MQACQVEHLAKAASHPYEATRCALKDIPVGGFLGHLFCICEMVKYCVHDLELLQRQQHFCMQKNLHPHTSRFSTSSCWRLLCLSRMAACSSAGLRSNTQSGTSPGSNAEGSNTCSCTLILWHCYFCVQFWYAISIADQKTVCFIQPCSLTSYLSDRWGSSLLSVCQTFYDPAAFVTFVSRSMGKRSCSAVAGRLDADAVSKVTETSPLLAFCPVTFQQRHITHRCSGWRQNVAPYLGVRFKLLAMP